MPKRKSDESSRLELAFGVGKTARREVCRILNCSSNEGAAAFSRLTAPQRGLTGAINDVFDKVSYKLVVPTSDGGEPLEWHIADPMLLLQFLVARCRIMRRLFEESLEKYPCSSAQRWRARVLSQCRW